MPYTLDQLGADIRSALTTDSGATGQRNALEFVTKALMDDAFIEQNLTGDGFQPRKILYEDPDLGFCICGHVYQDGMDRVRPHDHGRSWAIYGLAEGETEMTDWEVVQKGSGTDPTLVKPSRSYELDRGHCHLYEVGDIHSPIIGKGSKLVRVEGENLDNVKRSNIKAA